MPFPTNTTVLDSFPQADASPINSPWAQGTSISPTQTSLVRVSNTFASQSPTQYGSAYLTTATYGPDIELSVDITTLGLGQVGIGFRWTNPTSFATCTGYDVEVSGSNAFLNRFDPGTVTQVGANIALGVTPAAGDALGVQMSHDTVYVWFRRSGVWTFKDSRTDPNNAYTAAGYVALGCAGNVFRGDNLVGGDLPSVAVSNPNYSLFPPKLLAHY